MSRVLFIVLMDTERRAAVARKSAGAFESVILEDLPPEKRDIAMVFRSSMPEVVGRCAYTVCSG